MNNNRKTLANLIIPPRRLHRRGFLLRVLGLSIVVLMLAFVYVVIMLRWFKTDIISVNMSNSELVVIGTLLLLGSIEGIFLCASRLQDLNRSPYWLFLLLPLSATPYAGFLVYIAFALWPGTKGPNRFGESGRW